MTTAPTSPVLTWKHFPAGEHGFFRAPVLVSGPSEALLIDASFTYADARTVSEAILATGKRLKAIYVSQSDPDYYFGLSVLAKAFPDAKIIAASATVEAIRTSVAKKLAVWGPQLKENGPQSLDDIIIPDAFDEDVIMINGEPIEIMNADGLFNRRYLWVPALQAVFGGVLIFAGVHVWTADTQTKEQRAAWIDSLNRIADLQPSVVVPGHMTVDAQVDLYGVHHTLNYLLAFEEELARAKDSAALKAAMLSRFPGLGMEIALEIGAKVATGEMKWG